MHLSAWEQGIVALLQRQPRFEAMQLNDKDMEGKSEDGVNEIIYQRNSRLKLPAEAMEKYRASHREMLQVIDQLSDEDLRKPYIEYLPAGSEGPHAPVYHWISGNTYDHVDEHIRWINDILKSQGTKEEDYQRGCLTSFILWRYRGL